MSETFLKPEDQMIQWIISKWISKPIYVVAKLKIPDMLSDGPKSVDELAQMSKTHAPSLYRVMRALASLGIFSQTSDGRFELTPMAECLKAGAMGSIALMFQSDWHDKAWGNLLQSVRTGEVAFDSVHGMPIFDWFEENRQAERVYNEANEIKATTSHRAIIDVYDFSGIDLLTDIGGGYGALMAEILDANPKMRGIVADRSSVIKEAKELIQVRGLEARCKVMDCNFFKEIPAGSDAYLMSHILHDWNGEIETFRLGSVRDWWWS